jgi:type VI secretion system protein ImpH
LIQRLATEPYRFEFFQAVRLLLLQQRQYFIEADRDLLGQVIQFRSSISLAFPPSEIESLEFEWDEESADADYAYEVAGKGAQFHRVTLTPSFMGMTGPSGILPRHYTQRVAERAIYHRDTASRAFLDIFANRAIALFYQSWLKYRLPIQYEADRRNHFLPLVLSLAGIGLSGTRDRLMSGAGGVRDESLAYYATALRTRPQSILWFARVVGDYFQVRARIDQFVGQWLVLPDRELTRLGASNCLLGQTAFCGARVWDRQTRVRLVLGPLTRLQFDEFLPGGPAYSSLSHLFRLMIGTNADCEVRLTLGRGNVRAARLCAVDGTRLGWDSWIRSRACSSDSADTAYLISSTEYSQFS